MNPIENVAGEFDSLALADVLPVSTQKDNVVGKGLSDVSSPVFDDTNGVR